MPIAYFCIDFDKIFTVHTSDINRDKTCRLIFQDKRKVCKKVCVYFFSSIW